MASVLAHSGRMDEIEARGKAIVEDPTIVGPITQKDMEALAKYCSNLPSGPERKTALEKMYQLLQPDAWWENADEMAIPGYVLKTLATFAMLRNYEWATEKLSGGSDPECCHLVALIKDKIRGDRESYRDLCTCQDILRGLAKEALDQCGPFEYVPPGPPPPPLTWLAGRLYETAHVADEFESGKRGLKWAEWMPKTEQEAWLDLAKQAQSLVDKFRRPWDI